MLSFCIPIYNYDVTELVSTLHNQAVSMNILFEIVLLDDASSFEYRKINSLINLPNVRYIQLNENIGRSKIRNQLAKEAIYPYLVFMDCDSTLFANNYVKNYISCLKPGIVCSGGCTYYKEKPEKEYYLRWKFGVERESAYSAKRKLSPNYGFSSYNFLIDKNVFLKVQFEETLKGYGHEDTLFGIQLSIQGVTIEHIDNPLIHLGLESADIFLNKTENSIRNLQKINHILQSKYPEYYNHSNLLKTKKRIDKFRMSFFIKQFFRISKSLLKKNLLGKNPSLFLFDIYKIGFLCSLEGENDFS